MCLLILKLDAVILTVCAFLVSTLEEIQFSDEVLKCHKVTLKQPRNFVITKHFLYDFKARGKSDTRQAKIMIK